MTIKTYTQSSVSLLLFLMVLPLLSFTSKKDDTIKFIHTPSFKEIQDIAYEEEKPIFINFNAVWSTPCYKVKVDVFENDKVAEFMNAHYVNYSANIETKVGKALSEYFDVYHLPTLLIISPEGNVIMKSTGEQSPKKFLKWAKEANETYLGMKAENEAADE